MQKILAIGMGGFFLCGLGLCAALWHRPPLNPSMHILILGDGALVFLAVLVVAVLYDYSRSPK